MKKPTLLFDINETVLDLSSLKPLFVDLLGTELALPLWFSQLLHSSTVCSATNTQTNFRELANIALEQLAAKLQTNCSAEDRDRALGQLAGLSPHSDVLPAISRLNNSNPKSNRRPIASEHHIGLYDPFTPLFVR